MVINIYHTLRLLLLLTMALIEEFHQKHRLLKINLNANLALFNTDQLRQHLPDLNSYIVFKDIRRTLTQWYTEGQNLQGLLLTTHHTQHASYRRETTLLLNIIQYINFILPTCQAITVAKAFRTVVLTHKTLSDSHLATSRCSFFNSSDCTSNNMFFAPTPSYTEDTQTQVKQISTPTPPQHIDYNTRTQLPSNSMPTDLLTLNHIQTSVLALTPTDLSILTVVTTHAETQTETTQDSSTPILTVPTTHTETQTETTQDSSMPILTAATTHTQTQTKTTQDSFTQTLVTHYDPNIKLYNNSTPNKGPHKIFTGVLSHTYDISETSEPNDRFYQQSKQEDLLDNKVNKTSITTQDTNTTESSKLEFSQFTQYNTFKHLYT